MGTCYDGHLLRRAPITLYFVYIQTFKDTFYSININVTDIQQEFNDHETEQNYSETMEKGFNMWEKFHDFWAEL